MEGKSGITSQEMLSAISEIMDTNVRFDPTQPVVFSCGGIHLEKRKIPQQLLSWQTEIFLPSAGQDGIRIFRFIGESTNGSLKRILNIETLN